MFYGSPTSSYSIFLLQVPDLFGPIRTIAEGRGETVLIGTTKNFVLQGSLDGEFMCITQVNVLNSTFIILFLSCALKDIYIYNFFFFFRVTLMSCGVSLFIPASLSSWPVVTTDRSVCGTPAPTSTSGPRLLMWVQTTLPSAVRHGNYSTHHVFAFFTIRTKVNRFFFFF